MDIVISNVSKKGVQRILTIADRASVIKHQEMITLQQKESSWLKENVLEVRCEGASVDIYEKRSLLVFLKGSWGDKEALSSIV